MATTLTSKGQVTIPKRIRDALQLLPGTAVEFSINATGDFVLHPDPSASRVDPASEGMTFLLFSPFAVPRRG